MIQLHLIHQVIEWEQVLERQNNPKSAHHMEPYTNYLSALQSKRKRTHSLLSALMKSS